MNALTYLVSDQPTANTTILAADAGGDPVVAFLNSLIPGLGQFGAFLGLIGLVVGIIWFGFIVFSIILVVTGIPSLYGKGHNIQEGRERFQRGLVGFVCLAVAPFLLATIWTVVRGAVL